jgi:post-segregation antitoxin (ccd killing protein)
MARVNVYLPDDLAAEARAAGLNVSAVTQQALAEELARSRTNAWLASIATDGVGPTHDQVLEALDAARDELGG